MQPFREAATRAFLEDAQQLVPASIGSGGAWQALLAWMTRDQECRFGHLLDWRSPTSGSRSPVSGRSRPQDDREVIIRIVLNALLPQEIETKRRWETVNAALSNHRTQAGRLAWQLGHLRGRLAEYFGINTDSASRLDAKIIKEAASEHLAKVQGLPTAASLGQLRSARSDAERVFKKLADVQAAIEIASNKKESAEYLAKIMADQLPELSAQNQRLEHPVCPVCGVLIDKARAEGCGISLQGCDLEALRAKAAEQLGTWQNALSDAARLQAELTTLRGRLELANQELEQSRARLAGLERAMFDRSQDLSRAERAWDWALDFEQATTDLEETESAVGKCEDDRKALAEELGRHRSAVANLIGQLSDQFDAVFREMIPAEARCSVKLDGTGFGLKVPVDGAAIDSLKVAVFDLAVLSMAIEGKTRHPGLLIHDSPREADLGGSTYAGLFELGRTLEGFGAAPLFQYIVTTTTGPPDDFRKLPWLRLKLRSAPVEECLLKADL